MDILETIKSIDTALFLKLNACHSPFWDMLMLKISYRFTWIPFYLILLFLVWKRFGKRTLGILPVVLLLVLASDQISVHLFKDVFLRYRPCHNLNLQPLVHLNGDCGGTYGFISSHAANSFAIAMFLGMLFWQFHKATLFLLLFWATLVAYSRIYNGVHYPADVAVGALVGTLLAWLAYRLHLFVQRRYFYN